MENEDTPRPEPWPGAIVDADALSERLHQYLRDTEHGNPDMVRLTIDVPKEQFMLFTWMSIRMAENRVDKYEPMSPDKLELWTGLTQSHALSYIRYVLDNEFHVQLHGIAGHFHPLLFPPEKRPEPPPVDDDGIPFWRQPHPSLNHQADAALSGLRAGPCPDPSSSEPLPNRFLISSKIAHCPDADDAS